MGKKIVIDEDDFRYAYALAKKKAENPSDGMLGRLDRIQGQAILEAFFTLGLVDGDNEATPRFAE